MRVAAVTGSRADWGLLLPVLRAIKAHPQLQLMLWVTGSHLEARFGNTVNAIITDGFAVDGRIPLQLTTGDTRDTAHALARAIGGFADHIGEDRPDLMLVLGDRYEIFGAVQAALLAGVPVAHIAGGDISEGAYDDGMRHAISKLSHLHFPTNAEARDRLLQMGEQAERVILSGSPGIDAIVQTPRLSRDQLGAAIDFAFQPRNIAVSFHPATLDYMTPAQQVQSLTDALQQLDPNIGIVLSGSNADTGGDVVNQALQDFAQHRPNSCFVQSLGAQRYYSLIEQVDLLVGNSSSGLYEAPSLHTPTLNIGSRQQGRLHGASVRHCAQDSSAIREAIEQLLANPPQDFTNPYGDGQAAQRIVDALAAIDNPRSLLIKHFHSTGAGVAQATPAPGGPT